MKTKRVLGIALANVNHTERTGVESYAFFLLSALKKNVLEDVTIRLYVDRPLVPDLAEIAQGWDVRVLHWPPRRLWTQLRLSMEMLLDPPDMLFVPSHVMPIMHPQATFMTIHDVASLHFKKSYSFFERWYTIWSSKYALKHAKGIIVPSEATKKDLAQLSPKQMKKCHVVSHGYFSREMTKRRDVKKKYGISQPYLFFVGRIEEKKNVSRIIAAFDEVKKNHPDLQLVLGGKAGHGYDGVQKKMSASPSRTDIIETGYLPAADVQALMTEAEVFVFPSLYEGFGLPVLEAFAARCPVVTSQTSSLPEVAGNAAELVDPLDHQDIARGIALLLENKKIRDTRIGAGLRRLEHFSWKRCAQETLDVIVKV